MTEEFNHYLQRITKLWGNTVKNKRICEENLGGLIGRLRKKMIVQCSLV